jgi:hypothetical protein
MRRGVALLVLSAAAPLSAQPGTPTGVPPDLVFLGQVKTRAAANLSGLPNYTCTQTVERSRRRPASRKFELVDTLRLEVALVDGKEMFAWPGAERFEERDLSQMVGGTIGNGDFALFAKAVFLSGAARITVGGKESRNGRETIRLDFDVPRLVSGYSIRIGQQRATVGFEGAAWVDAGTLDLVRLEVKAKEIPPNLPLLESFDVIEYERLRIGDGDFLLPKWSEMTLTGFDGSESRNRIAFSRCRHYGSNSTLTFDEAPATRESPKEVVSITLPGDLEIPIRLTTALRSPAIATGDLVEAEVSRDVKRKGEVIVPKGARIQGRVVEYTSIAGPYELHALGLRLDRITFENKQGVLLARLVSPQSLGIPTTRDPRTGVASVPAPTNIIGMKTPDLIYVRGKVDLPAGFGMLWRTQAGSMGVDVP